MNFGTHAVVHVVAGVLLALSIPASARGDIPDRTQEPSVFDLSIAELMNVEISVPLDAARLSCPPRQENMEAQNRRETVQPASSHDAAEPGIPSLPVRQPAKSDVR